MDTIGQRLRHSRKQRGLSQAEYGELGGVTKRSQMLYETDQRIPRGDYFAALLTEGVDVDFILTGRETNESSEFVSFEPKETNGLSSETYSVPLYDVEGAAGAGRSLEHETVIGHFPLTAELVAQFGLADARLAGIRVRGDSMEPTLFDGDWTFVNLNDTNWSLGGVFLVWVSGELRIKRVQRLAGGAMYLISDNTHYEKEMIARDRMQEVSILGRVKTRLGDIS